MIGCWEKLYFAFQFNARFLKSGQRRHCKALFIFTRPYAAEGTADLDGFILGCLNVSLRASGAKFRLLEKIIIFW